jgi:hypothetical protein
MTHPTAPDRLVSFFNSSPLVAVLERLKSASGPSRLFGDKVRGLTKKEIEALVAQGNYSADWIALKVAFDFSPAFIRGNTFAGACVLGAFCGCDAEAAPGVLLPNGIYTSMIVGSEIGSNCLVRDCGLVGNYLVEDDAVLVGVGSLTAAAGCAFGNGTIVSPGSETGGREIALCAELDPELAARLLLERRDKDFLRAYAEAAARYRTAVTADFGVVETGSIIRHSVEIRNTFMGAGARIEGAALIDNCTILSAPGEEVAVGHGAIVKDSCLQWRSAVDTHAIVVASLLGENVRVERHGKVTGSVIGPNSTIAEGEVTASLVGPFTGFHHQALLIGALWPAGRGNVASGANVGSNHTSRLPDQELHVGEGVFFGLGSSVKFPADFTRAPYTVIATGVTTLPQRLKFPFSLIASPARAIAGLSPAINELSPGWVLSDNIYLAIRSERKNRERNKAMRTRFDFTVFRPEIVDCLVAARDLLCAVKTPQEFYTDRDIAGLGKNYLTEARRQSGIAVYAMYIEFYCLEGLFRRIRQLAVAGKIDAVFTEKTDDAVWEHRRGILISEGWDKRSLRENLERLVVLLQKIAEDAYRAKAKDDERGVKIISDYSDVAIGAEDDGLVKSLRAETAAAVKVIRGMIESLPG